MNTYWAALVASTDARLIVGAFSFAHGFGHERKSYFTTTLGRDEGIGRFRTKNEHSKPLLSELKTRNLRPGSVSRRRARALDGLSAKQAGNTS